MAKLGDKASGCASVAPRNQYTRPRGACGIETSA